MVYAAVLDSNQKVEDMNTKLTLISIASITLAVGVSLQPAFAGRGARFDFAPNYYRLEQSSPPPVSYHPTSHAVRSGHVPSSKDILGIDPGSLPVAPVVNTQTQARLTQVTNTHYKEAFGAPVNAPVMAALPATALNLPKASEKALSANKAVSAKLMNKKGSGNVYGKLLRKNHTSGNSAQALALGPAASYGKNFGYEPGSVTPATYGNGMNVNTAVSGRLLHH